MASTCSTIAFGMAAKQGRRNGICFRHPLRRLLQPHRAPPGRA